MDDSTNIARHGDLIVALVGQLRSTRRLLQNYREIVGVALEQLHALDAEVTRLRAQDDAQRDTRPHETRAA